MPFHARWNFQGSNGTISVFFFSFENLFLSGNDGNHRLSFPFLLYLCSVDFIHGIFDVQTEVNVNEETVFSFHLSTKGSWINIAESPHEPTIYHLARRCFQPDNGPPIPSIVSSRDNEDFLRDPEKLSFVTITLG